MRIGFNLIPYTNTTGLTIYALEIIKHLKLLPEDELILFTNQKSAAIFKGAHPQAKIIKHNFLFLNNLSLTLYQQFAFILSLKKNKIDLLFCPSLSLPLAWRRKIVVIHDLSFRRFKKESGRLGRLYLKLALLSAKYFSKKIVTISEFSRQEIATLLKIPSARIAITPRGAPQLITTEPDEEKEILKKFSLLENSAQIEKYFLYLGAGYYRKNLKRSLQAFKLFAQKHPDYKLVIAGKMDEGLRQLKNSQEAQVLKNSLVFIGPISEAEKTVLLKNSLALILFSLYEGFGITALEAQAAKTPVLAGSGSCLPEIAGSGALFANPLNIQEMAKALEIVSQDKELRNELIAKGIDNLDRYRWEELTESWYHLLKE